ncbi:MAG: DUF1080 domain-containing protein [Saprospiraceae bacterium]|nr:DUF1080 domain-containing protein [Lewinella sp.]
MNRSLLLIGLLLLAGSVFAQRQAEKTLSLDDLSAFKPQAGNWMVVGNVTMNPLVDIHEHDAPPPPPVMVEEPKKKKRKKRKKEQQEEMAPPPPPKPKAVTFADGTGILLNMNDESKRDQLITNWEHGDIILDLEVMIPKGSNSGIYLQGRYEVQLLDSWGVKDPSFSDIGGIYRNWESEKGKIYMGKAPITNAAKAPGLWQHMQIAFRAPRFNDRGEKTENARFISVDLNGVRIHENLEVPLPTGGPIKNDEVATGPLMIQGDHGPVAFRNIKYQLLEETQLSLNDITYSYFEGEIPSLDALNSMTATAEGSLPELTVVTEHPQESFGMLIKGKLNIPKAGKYAFRMNYVGNADLQVEGASVQMERQGWRNQFFTIDLNKGSYPFTLRFLKNEPWDEPRLGLFDLGSFPRALHAYSSFPLESRQAPPIYVEVGNQPRLLRAFIDFDGDRSKRLTHTIGVGTPGGTHFVYDLKAGSPVCVWRGEFINATPMWNSRGDGSFRPRGATQYLFTGSSVAMLAAADSAFPNTLNEIGDFKNKGYRIDPASSLPIFLYSRDTLQLEDMIRPDESGNALVRTLSFQEGVEPEGYTAKLAEGMSIEQLPNGIYVVDQQYYIKIETGQTATIRKMGDRQELISPLSGTALTYSINW